MDEEDDCVFHTRSDLGHMQDKASVGVCVYVCMCVYRTQCHRWLGCRRAKPPAHLGPTCVKTRLTRYAHIRASAKHPLK